MANIVTEDEGISPPQMGGAQAGAANALASREAYKNSKYAEFFAAKAKNLCTAPVLSVLSQGSCS